MGFFDDVSSFFKGGLPGKDMNVGACPGRREEEDGAPFSKRGQSGKRLREQFKDFDDSTLANVSRQPRYAPRDKRTQPTVNECLADEEHIENLREAAKRTREHGGKVRTFGTVSRDVFNKAGIEIDEEEPHPSGRNTKRRK